MAVDEARQDPRRKLLGQLVARDVDAAILGLNDFERFVHEVRLALELFERDLEEAKLLRDVELVAFGVEAHEARMNVDLAEQP